MWQNEGRVSLLGFPRFVDQTNPTPRKTRSRERQQLQAIIIQPVWQRSDQARPLSPPHIATTAARFRRSALTTVVSLQVRSGLTAVI